MRSDHITPTDTVPALAWMAFFACGPGQDLIAEFPAIGNSDCCMGALEYGPAYCTCWQPVYDVEQQPVDQEQARWLAVGVQPVTRTRMCDDCAYRPGSPEKSGDPSYLADQETLERLAADAQRFWCHQGMTIPLKWVHPSGAEAPGHAGSYDPPVRDGVPYRADGSPAELCAGWDARRRALAAGTGSGS